MLSRLGVGMGSLGTPLSLRKPCMGEGVVRQKGATHRYVAPGQCIS